jgi:hypothetical protein
MAKMSATEPEIPEPYRVRAERGLGMVWAIGCPICKKPIPLGIDQDKARELAATVPVHPDCRDKPSVRTPTLDGLDLSAVRNPYND